MTNPQRKAEARNNVTHENAALEILRDVILDKLLLAGETTLLDVYARLKADDYANVPSTATAAPAAVPSSIPAALTAQYYPRPTPPPPAGTSEADYRRALDAADDYPGSTIAIVRRALGEFSEPVRLAEVYARVQAEQPAISKASVSGALGRLVQQGRAIRQGAPRSGEYKLKLPR